MVSILVSSADEARHYLRNLKPYRSDRAVLPGKKALEYRFRSRQFYDIDYKVFVHLYASLTGPQLSKVAAAPNVIQEFKIEPKAFHDHWFRLYEDTRKEEPVLAALSLVGTLKSVVEAII